MAERWYISNGVKTLGPYSAAALRKMAAEGKLKPRMQLSADQEQWVLARDSEFLAPPALDPLPDPFADDEVPVIPDPPARRPALAAISQDDDDSGPIASGVAGDSGALEAASEAEDSDVLEGVAFADDDSGVIEAASEAEDSGVLEGVAFADGDSGVIEAASEAEDSGVLEGAAFAEAGDSGAVEAASEAEDSGVLEAAARRETDGAAGTAVPDGERYRFRATDAEGREQADELNASSTADAFRQLRARGLVPKLAYPRRRFAGWPDRPPPLPRTRWDRARALLERIGRALFVAGERWADAAALQLAITRRVYAAHDGPPSEWARALSLAGGHALLCALVLVATAQLGSAAVALAGGAVAAAVAGALPWAGLVAALQRIEVAAGTRSPGSASLLARLDGSPSRLLVLGAVPGLLLALGLIALGLAPGASPTGSAFLAALQAGASELVGIPRAFTAAGEPPGDWLRVFARAGGVALLFALAGRELAEQLPLRAAVHALGRSATREAAVGILSRWSPPPVAALIGTLARSPEPEQRQAIAAVLSVLPSAPVSEALVRLAAQDAARDARGEIAWALGRMGTPEATRCLCTALTEPGWWAHRLAVIEALDSQGDRQSAPALVAVLEDLNHHEVHARAARALVSLDDPESRPALWALLDGSGDPVLRAIAAAGLGRVGDSRDLDPLSERLADEAAPIVIAWLERAIDHIETPESRGTLEALSHDLAALGAVPPPTASDADDTDLGSPAPAA